MPFQPNSRPVIKAAPSFVGLGVIDTNPYIPGGGGAQWVCTIIGIEHWTCAITNYLSIVYESKQLPSTDS